MKQMISILVLAILFPAAAIVQASEPEPSAPGLSQRLDLSSRPLAQSLTAPAVRRGFQVQRTPPPPRPESDTVRPRMADSATGYIDNAIVGSQVRIRFDSGFNVDSPDRAEFFYGKCGCYRFAPANDPAFDPDAPGPGGPGQVENSLYFQELHFEAEYQMNERLSVSADVPARSIQPSVVPRTIGIGDVRVGFKFAVDASEDRYVTLQLRTYIPSGNARRGLGTNHTSVEPAVLFHQRLSGGFSVAGQAALWHPIGGSSGVPTAADEKFAGDVLVYGFGASQDLYSGPGFRLTPVVEFVGWKVFDGFQTATLPPEADGVNILNLKVGARVDSGGPSSFYLGFGKALTDELWYEDILRLEYRFVF